MLTSERSIGAFSKAMRVLNIRVGRDLVTCDREFFMADW